MGQSRVENAFQEWRATRHGHLQLDDLIATAANRHSPRVCWIFWKQGK